MSKPHHDFTRQSVPSRNSKTLVKEFGQPGEVLGDYGDAQSQQKIAIRHNGVDYTATELIADARRLATAIPRGNSPVVTLLPRGYQLYVSQLAVLLQGGFFVPIDVRTPMSRIEFLFQDSRAKIVLTDQVHAARLDEHGTQLDVIDVQTVLDSDIAVEADAESRCGTAADEPGRIDLASLIPHQEDDFVYMIYTSGSTGQPKGVPIHWRAMDNHYQWFIKEYGVTADDRCMQISSPGFDISIEEIWGSLQIGATLHVVDDAHYESAENFWRWVQENRITILDFSTALWQALLPVLVDRGSLPESVRLAIIGGEAVSPADIELWFSAVDPDRVRLSNCYGPTETTITSTHCDLSPSGTVTIGKPIDNMRCVLVDEAGHKVEQRGEIGEIYISGESVGQGYWHRAEKTAEAFSNFEVCDGQWSYRTGDLAYWDENDDLVFCGRRDGQVKLRGYRIELGEIETAIRQHADITNCVVKKMDLGNDQLVAFVCTAQAPDSGRDQQLSEQISLYLASDLPEYMIPSRYYFMQNFPLTPSGKIDRKHLEQLIDAQIESHAPADQRVWESELKTSIAAAWKAATGYYPGTDDQSFAQAGGDSLGAMALITELRRSFAELNIGISAIGAGATLNSISEYVELQFRQSAAVDGAADQPPITVLQQSNPQSKRWLLLFHPAGGGCLMYEPLLTDEILDQFMVVTVESPYLTGPMPKADGGSQNDIESIAAAYADAIAAASLNWSSADEIVMAGYSFGGVMAYEVGRLLRQRNMPINQVINIDQPVPTAIKKCGIAGRLVNWLYRLRQPLLAYRDQQRVRRDRRVLKVALGTAENTYGFSQVELRSMQLEDYYCRVESEYHPHRSELWMDLIHGGVFEAKYALTPGHGWTDLVAALKVHKAHGTHSTLFLQPNVRQLRRLFAEAVGRSL